MPFNQASSSSYAPVRPRRRKSRPSDEPLVYSLSSSYRLAQSSRAQSITVPHRDNSDNSVPYTIHQIQPESDKSQHDESTYTSCFESLSSEDSRHIPPRRLDPSESIVDEMVPSDFENMPPSLSLSPPASSRRLDGLEWSLKSFKNESQTETNQSILTPPSLLTTPTNSPSPSPLLAAPHPHRAPSDITPKVPARFAPSLERIFACFPIGSIISRPQFRSERPPVKFM